MLSVLGLLLVGTYVATHPTYAQGNPQGQQTLNPEDQHALIGDIDDDNNRPGGNERDPDQPQRNLNPVITPELVPGFSLQFSDLSSEFVSESWVKEFDGGRNPTFINLRLHLLKNQTECLSRAKDLYRATANNQFRGVDSPTSGSYSGQSIGDYCWAYTRSMLPHPRGSINGSSVVIVVKGNNLFTLMVTCVDGGVHDSFTEGLAKAVVERLNVWPRPTGSNGNNGVGNGPDPQPPGNPPVNDPPGSGPGNPGNRGGSKN